MANKDCEQGCYFDGSRGVYMGLDIQKLAESKGWTPDEGIITDHKHEDYHEVMQEAEDWLNEFVVIEGCYWGYNDYGDFGLWSMVTE